MKFSKKKGEKVTGYVKNISKTNQATSLDSLLSE
jgi:hypothetical protein